MPIIENDFMELTKNLDIEAFWAENEQCDPLTMHKPRCAVSFSPDDHWLFEFMNVSSTVRYYQDKAYRDSLHQEVNQVTKQFVGKAFFTEDTWQHGPRRIENLFGSYFEYLEGGTPWLTHVTDDPAEFAKILDQVEATNLRTWSFPEEFLAEWETRKNQGEDLPLLGTGSRGPATIMTTVLKPETALLWLFDQPELMQRFRDVLMVKMVEFNTILREFSGNTEPGWWITDDNCALFSPKLYKEYCYPVLEKLLAAMAPDGARHYQTDYAQFTCSAMALAIALKAQSPDGLKIRTF